jgi:plasmid stabilization system protein ParE
MRNLVLRPPARTDIVEAARWYEEQAEGLGADFLRAVDLAVATIQHNPLQYQQIYGRVRRHVVIYYVSDDEIVIVSCIHGRRDPESWQDRVP